MQLVSMVYSNLYINEPYVSANYIRSIRLVLVFCSLTTFFMYIVAYINL